MVFPGGEVSSALVTDFLKVKPGGELFRLPPKAKVLVAGAVSDPLALEVEIEASSGLRWTVQSGMTITSVLVFDPAIDPVPVLEEDLP